MVTLYGLQFTATTFCEYKFSGFCLIENGKFLSSRNWLFFLLSTNIIPVIVSTWNASDSGKRRMCYFRDDWMDEKSRIRCRDCLCIEVQWWQPFSGTLRFGHLWVILSYFSSWIHIGFDFFLLSSELWVFRCDNSKQSQTKFFRALFIRIHRWNPCSPKQLFCHSTVTVIIFLACTAITFSGAKCWKDCQTNWNDDLIYIPGIVLCSLRKCIISTA